MKVKIKSLDIQDIRLFDTVYAYAEIKICGIDELWTVDEYIPAVNRPKLAETDSLDQLKHYLDTNPGRKVIFLDHGESMLTSVRFYIEPNGLLPYCESRRLAIIGSGDFPKDWLWTNLDIYLEITASTYNTLVSLNSIEQIYNKKPKPYKFLFLNNKRRDYRTQLI